MKATHSMFLTPSLSFITADVGDDSLIIKTMSYPVERFNCIKVKLNLPIRLSVSVGLMSGISKSISVILHPRSTLSMKHMHTEKVRFVVFFFMDSSSCGHYEFMTGISNVFSLYSQYAPSSYIIDK